MYLPKPAVHHPRLPHNALGLTRRDYEGAISTLCAGCGHDSVTAAIIQAAFELDLPPASMVKMSGIGCSSKTPAYFLSAAHGFNSVHGRMPSVTTGANLAHRDLVYLGVSGDGDTASIGLGQFMHAMRRRLRMAYIVENNGAYGLTKGQFSATADRGSKSKRGAVNVYEPLDPVVMALTVGASYVARSFSGDKAQLVPLIQGALRHQGFALIDVISPCVTFNNHEGSTKSYQYVREHDVEVVHADFVPHRHEVTADYAPGTSQTVSLSDGSSLRLSKLEESYDPRNREDALRLVREHQARGEIVTGLLYIDPDATDLHETLGTVREPLRELKFEDLCPGSATLGQLMESFR